VNSTSKDFTQWCEERIRYHGHGESVGGESDDKGEDGDAGGRESEGGAGAAAAGANPDI